MQVRVLFFGQLGDAAGTRATTANLPSSARVSDLLAHCKSELPGVAEFLSSIAVSVNQEYASATTPLHENDEVALLPPVSGGSSPATQSESSARIVRQKIDLQPLLDSIKTPADGACIVFEGIVRDNSRGRRTLYLDYEAYEEMAQKQMDALLAQAKQKFQISDARIIHRLGHLNIGETSVLIIVASAHRDAAFDACRWLIDTVKTTVPIWKKEFFADGAVWASGEPFPSEITLREKSQ